MSKTQSFVVKREGGRLEFKLKNPPANFFDQNLVEQITEKLEEFRGDDDLKVIVFSSGLAGIFSKGFDFNDLAPERVGSLVSSFGHMLSVLNNQKAITIVEVDGLCEGGAMELAAYCDIIIASDRSWFGHPEVSYGLFPPIAAALYTHLIGRNRTIDMLVTGRDLTAKEAYEIGLITRVWPGADFAIRVREFYAAIEEKSALTIHLTKKAIEKSLYSNVSDAVSTTENIYLNELLPSHDAQEGISSYLAGKRPTWKNK